ncbi:MAG: Small archaeal modifier protein 1 [Methanosaeta sp. PtaU1.Bin060]|jgi:molybdopterin synthase sulfur carrier subunit|nr:MAG: Small archaeal modifier protein 1 [Methanosaeta sp. PtaU1.Bin060]
MKVHVRAFANFREILGGDLSVDLEKGSTVGDLLESLCSSRQRQQLRSAIFDDAGRVREYVIIMKNRKDVSALRGLETVLEEGDEVAILPPVAGG